MSDDMKINKMKLDYSHIDTLKLGMELDGDFWRQYICEVHPDDREYITYVRWLCLKLNDYREKG